jgi:hypothetical protein
MSSEQIKQILKDADILGYTRADVSIEYDLCADFIAPRLNKDMSIAQLEELIWRSFYAVFYAPYFSNPDKNQATYILGTPERYKGIAVNIRHIIFEL